ncbi:MAG: outer membrane protein assembly factor BamB, partial [Verrucomicrobiales bacterium]
EWQGQTLLATVKTEGLAILDAKDGETLAFQEWKTRFSTNANTPIVRGDKVFLSTGYNRGCGLFHFTGDGLEEIYTSEHMSNHMSNCVLVGDHLYGFHGNTHTGQTRELRCIEFTTGKLRWSQGGFGIGGLTAAGDRLIILGEKGELAIAKATPEGFSAIRRAQVSTGKHWNVPVLANAHIYVRNAAGALVALDVAE